MPAARPWTRTEVGGLLAGLILFFLLQQGYLTGPIAEVAPYQSQKSFLDAQFWIFTTSHAEKGLGVTHGLPVWRVADDGSLCVHNSHPPTVALLEWVCAWFWGPTLPAVRLPALLFSTALLGLLYLLLRRAFPPIAAALGTIGLAGAPLFFHFATCPEVFLLAHLPLLAVLYIALFGFAPPPPPPLPPEPDSFPPEASHQLLLDSRTRLIEQAELHSRRRRRWALLGLSAAAVFVSYHALGVILLWAVAWWACKRTRQSLLESLCALAGAAAALGLCLLWLHLGGGSVSHWASRGLFRAFGGQNDRVDVAGAVEVDEAAQIGWGRLAATQWGRVFEAEGYLAWLALIGVGLSCTYLFRRDPEAVAGRAQAGQRGLLLALTLMCGLELFGLKQNAWTHVYTVSAFLLFTAFGLAVIGELAALGFQRIGLARGATAPAGLKHLRVPYVMGIILSLTALGILVRLAEVIDAHQVSAPQSDVAPFAAAIDAARAANPGPVLVYSGWLLPAHLVTGENQPPDVGYLYPWYYRGHAWLCYRRPQMGPEHFRDANRPTVLLRSVAIPFGDSPIRAQAIRGVLREQGYTQTQVGYLVIWTANPFTLPPAAAALPPVAPPPPATSGADGGSRPPGAPLP